MVFDFLSIERVSFKTAGHPPRLNLSNNQRPIFNAFPLFNTLGVSKPSVHKSTRRIFFAGNLRYHKKSELVFWPFSKPYPDGLFLSLQLRRRNSIHGSTTSS